MKRGFTLIELLVVVLIIGILSAVALPQYNKAVLRSKYVQLQVIARSFADAANVYYMANGKAPDYWSELDLSVPAGCATTDEMTVKGGLSCLRSGGSIKFYCDLQTGDKEDIACFLYDGSSYPLGYSHFFGPNHSSPLCLATEENQGICKSMGGVEDGTYAAGVCSSHGLCKQYRLK